MPGPVGRFQTPRLLWCDMLCLLNKEICSANLCTPWNPLESTSQSAQPIHRLPGQAVNPKLAVMTPHTPPGPVCLLGDVRPGPSCSTNQGASRSGNCAPVAAPVVRWTAILKTFRIYSSVQHVPEFGGSSHPVIPGFFCCSF